MIDLCYSNRTEPLLDALAENVESTQATLYDPVHLLVPNAFVEDYVKQGLARRRGIAAHIKTGFSAGFLREVAEASAPDLHIVDRDTIEGELLALFHDGHAARVRRARRRSAAISTPTTRTATALDRRRAQLAAQLAELFDEYAYSRPGDADRVAQGRARSRDGTSRCSAGSASCGWRCSVRGGPLAGADERDRCPTSSRARRPAALRVPGAVARLRDLVRRAPVSHRSSRRWRA